MLNFCNALYNFLVNSFVHTNNVSLHGNKKTKILYWNVSRGVKISCHQVNITTLTWLNYFFPFYSFHSIFLLNDAFTGNGFPWKMINIRFLMTSGKFYNNNTDHHVCSDAALDYNGKQVNSIQHIIDRDWQENTNNILNLKLHNIIFNILSHLIFRSRMVSSWK